MHNKLLKILLTGGNNGIGFQMVLQFLQDGHKVAVFDLSLDNLTAYKEKYSEDLMLFECDMTNQQVVTHCVNEVNSVFNGIDYAIHNACKYFYQKFEDTTDDDYTKVFNVNYYGAIHLTRAVLPIMKEQSSGRVFYTSSITGVTGFSNDSAYSPSKAALDALAKCLNIECRDTGVTFHLIHPPHTGTESVKRWIVAKEYMNDPHTVGVGLVKNIHKNRFIICYSLSHYIQIRIAYMFPVGWGRFLNALVSQKKA